MARAWIVYGPAGTGKTRQAPSLSLGLTGWDDRYVLGWAPGDAITDGYLHICDGDPGEAPDDVELIRAEDRL